ncbi:hypothetical protein DV738_g5315, partial [Chaetothyriales sp. CBS 135597]
MSLPDSKKRLALSVIDFLSTSLKDGTLTADDAENIEIATNCIADAFKVDPSDKSAVSEAVGSQSLFNIFTVYEKLKGSQGSASTATATSGSGSASASASAGTGAGAGAKATASSGPNPEAEKLKSAGNAAMQQKDYKTAIEKYTQAIALSPTNPIYLSNRAAAYSASGDHVSAVKDAEIAVTADPKYIKAWSRLGLARFALGDAKGSVEAYQKGIEHEGSGGSEAMKKGLETAKRELARIEAEEDDGSNGLDGGPGATRGIARNMMQNPDALNSLMSNPMLQNMLNQRQAGGGAGGGLPDVSQLQQMMQDPSIASLAQQFMGGAGGAGAGAGRGRGVSAVLFDVLIDPVRLDSYNYTGSSSRYLVDVHYNGSRSRYLVDADNDMLYVLLHTDFDVDLVTSTVIYYTQTCQACCYGCGGQQPTETAVGATGTTTVTSYTTYTPGATESNQGQAVTTTSNGYVIIITTTTPAANAQATAAATVSVYQVTNGVATPRPVGRFPWLSAGCLAVFACLIAAL